MTNRKQVGQCWWAQCRSQPRWPRILYYPSESPRNVRLLFSVEKQNTLKKAAAVYCPVFILLLSSPDRNLSWFCNDIAGGSHYHVSKHKSFQHAHLYLQQDHQQFPVVASSVTADIFLQFTSELWRKEQKKGRSLLTPRCYLTTTANWWNR